MQRIELEAAHEAVFMRNGLETFDDIFSYETGEMINRNEKRDVSILRLDVPDCAEGCHVYYRKRFFSPHPKDMLFTIRNFGKLCSQAELEWRNAHILLNNGIETYRPVVWGAETWCGIERRSFFITDKIDGESLINFLLDRWGAFDRAEQEKLVVGLARFFNKIHQARLCLPDSYLWHLFLLEPIETSPAYRFAIIDLHRMQINAGGWRHAARNLGALLFSLPDEWFDAQLRELFVNSYLEPVNGESMRNRDAFLETLKKREQTLISRRKKPDIERIKQLA